MALANEWKRPNLSTPAPPRDCRPRSAASTQHARDVVTASRCRYASRCRRRYQRQLKAVQREAMKKEDDHFRAKMLEKFAEDDRIDQLNSQRRRQKQIEHRHAIERLLEERRAA